MASGWGATFAPPAVVMLRCMRAAVAALSWTRFDSFRGVEQARWAGGSFCPLRVPVEERGGRGERERDRARGCWRAPLCLGLDTAAASPGAEPSVAHRRPPALSQESGARTAQLHSNMAHAAAHQQSSSSLGGSHHPSGRMSSLRSGRRAVAQLLSAARALQPQPQHLLVAQALPACAAQALPEPWPRVADARTARWQQQRRCKGSNTLSGRNIFQLRAAQAVEAQTAPAPEQEHPAPVIELPTSDESETLLRIRHSVSATPS